MEFWQGALTVLVTVVVTKAADHLMAVAKENRDFDDRRRDQATKQIEELKDEVGGLYELSANLSGYEVKREGYEKAFAKKIDLIGKYNKYPEIAAAARDAIHWCEIVASDEKDKRDSRENRKELADKYKTFLQMCEKRIEDLRYKDWITKSLSRFRRAKE